MKDQRKELNEIVEVNRFEHAQMKDNLVTYKTEEITIKNIVKKCSSKEANMDFISSTLTE